MEEPQTEAESRAQTRKMLDPHRFRWKATDLPDLRACTTETTEFTASKPAYKMLEEAVKDSYYKAGRNANISRTEIDKGGYEVHRRRQREYSPISSSRRFRVLDDTSEFAPPPDRLYSNTHHYSTPYTSGSGISSRKYAAPSTFNYGTDSDDEGDAALSSAFTAPTSRYLTRRTMGDPDYYDYDLTHAVETCRLEQQKYMPRPVNYHDSRKLTDISRTPGMEPVAANIFLNKTTDWRDDNSNLLSCALRTPGFWTKRFENLLEDKNHLESTYTVAPSASSSGAGGAEFGNPITADYLGRPRFERSKSRSTTPFNLADYEDDD